MSRIAIVADDLTGAADAAAHLARGAETVLLLDARADWPDAAVVAVDTDTRDAEPERAAEAVRQAVGHARAEGRLVYKKIDSTLRGNVAVEVAAAAAALSSDRRPVLAVVAPAFPALGRTTVDGLMLVDGLPLRQPYGGSVPDLLRAGGLTSTVARPDASLRTAISQARVAGVGALVVDSATDADLATVFATGLNARETGLLVGSGGLARHYEGLLDGRTPTEPPSAGPVLVVMGSWSPRARAQAAALEAAGAVPVAPGHRAPERLGSVLSASGIALLRPDPGAPVDTLRSRETAAELARAAVPILDLAGAVVATGGDTARALLVAAGIDRLRVGGEVEPGIVWSRAPDRRFVIVTKAGAFGDDHVLVRTIRQLTGRHHP